MAKPLNGFRAALLAGWVVLGAAGFLYQGIRGIPSWAALPALAAFLVEYSFYLVPAFPAVRERLAGPRLPAFLAVSTVLPYLACCTGAIHFRWLAVVQLAALALALGLWYYVLPRSALTDIAFGALLVWVIIGKYFDPIYPEPFDHVELSILGKVAVFRNAVLVLMLARGVPETGYGFIPNWREWRIGILHFLCFAPVALALGLITKAVAITPARPLWYIAGTFFGILWTTALAEEFFFRGVLQPLAERWSRSRVAGLATASAAFGLVHLPFGRQFPNWRWVLLAGTLGVFCGLAPNRAGGIRAAMVTHTLAVTAWRAYLNP